MIENAIYVSAEGSKNSDGSLNSPCSLKQSLDIIAGRRKQGNYAPVKVVLHDGEYRLSKTLRIHKNHAGEGLEFVAVPGAEPKLSGAVPISSWSKMETPVPGIFDKPPADLWVAPLPQTESGETIQPKTLYRDATRLSRARTQLFAVESQSLHSFTVKNRDDAVWANASALELFIRPSQKWCFNILPVAELEPGSGTVLTKVPATYPLTGECWIENALSSLQSSGDFVTHPAKGLIYYRSQPGKPPEDSLRIPVLEELICVMGNQELDDSIKNVSFEGITFMHGERYTIEKDDFGLQHDWDFYDKPNSLLRFRYADNCLVRNCRFLSSGGSGIRIDLHAKGIIVDNNEFYRLGATAILAAGFGPGLKDENGNHTISANHIHNCADIYRHAPGIFIWQSGKNHISRNHIHGLPYTAIVISSVRASFFVKTQTPGRENTPTIRWEEVGDLPEPKRDTVLPYRHSQGNIIEYNYIHNVVKGEGFPIAMGDGNGIYLSGTDGDNEVRRNVIAAIHEGHGGIRTDDECWVTNIHHNILTDCWFVSYVHKHANTFTNNFILIPPYSSAIAFRAEDQHEGTRVSENIFLAKSWGCTLFLEKIRTKGIVCNKNQFWTLINPHNAEKVLRPHHEAGLDLDSVIAFPALYEKVAGIDPLELTVAQANDLADQL